jgi:hypothetical protein
VSAGGHCRIAQVIAAVFGFAGNLLLYISDFNLQAALQYTHHSL